MKEKIIFELGSFYINSGIIGLIKMLELDDPYKSKWSLNEEQLLVDKEYLLNTDLTELFIKTTNELEMDTGKLPRILKKLKEYSAKTDLTDSEIKELINAVKELEANSYKNAYEVLKSNNENLEDLYKIIEKIKKEKQISDIKKIIEILEKEEVFKILFFREIAYRRINKFWDSISFLNRNNAKKDLKQTHFETFEKPFKEFIKNKTEGKLYCEECGEPISKKDCLDYSFLKGTTADVVRKRNDFWNYKVNSWVCPKCRWVYSLIPLGFSKYYQKYLFKNFNITVDSLRKANEEIYKNEFKETEDKTVQNANILTEFLNKQTAPLNNIEIIMAGVNDKRFIVDIIPKESLEIIKENESYLTKLINHNVKVNDEYINLLDIALNNIIRCQDNYNLINWLLKRKIMENNTKLFYSGLYLFKIQVSLNKKRRGEKENMEKQIKAMKYLGEELQKKIFEKKQTKDKSVLTSITYKLLNAARLNDIDSFTDIVIRACMSYEAPVPTLLINCRYDKEGFADLAYSYILGIQNEKKEGND